MEGFANAVDVFWIGNPAVVLSFLACARVDGDDGLTFEPTRRNTWHGSLGNDGAETVFCIYGCLTALFFIGDVDQDLDEAAIGSLGDVISEGVYDDVAFGAEKGFVISGVIEVTREAGVVPEQDGRGAFGFVACGCDHAIEVITTDCRAA